MDCPECNSSRLTPVKLEPSLPAKGCGSCRGALLDLVTYRLWTERHTHELTGSGDVVAEPQEGRAALLCPGCTRIMLRFRYTADTPHVLDVCMTCDHAWLQGNEWEFLKCRALHGELTQVFTDPWQQNLRKTRTREVLGSEWDRRLGADLHAEIQELREWLKEHPKRQDLLDYLRSDEPYGA